VVSISEAQIACLQAQVPIDLEESATVPCGSSVGGVKQAIWRRIAYFGMVRLASEMAGLVLRARDALVVFGHVCRWERILRIWDSANICYWRKISGGGTRANQTVGRLSHHEHVLYLYTSFKTRHALEATEWQ